VHAAFLDYVKQVLMPTPIPGDSVIKDNSVVRRLAAILAADVVDYSRLMGEG
jgi:class 3 adenylate cyclase